MDSAILAPRVTLDEAIRWESPVQKLFRTATRDISVAGGVAPEGDKILVFLGSAIRDSRHLSNTVRAFASMRVRLVAA